MIHDGGYYNIVDKYKILSLLDEIEQKIIWMCHQNFIWHNLMQDPDTPTHMEALSGRNISHVRRSEGQLVDSTSGLSLGCIKWNIDDVSS